MKTFPVILATTFLVAIVSGQDSTLQGQGPIQPFQNPGEIIPGLTVSYLINAAGGIWQQERVIDSLAYTCTDVLPYLGSIIPDVDNASLYWGPICDQVIEAADDLDAFNATGFCNNIIGMINSRIPRDNGTSDFRYRRQAGLPMEYPGSMDDYLDIIGTLINITRKLYGIDINMIISDPSTINIICINVKDNFLRPSLQDLISQFGAELLSVLLAHESAISDCQDWDGYLQTLGINSSSPIYPIIQDAARIWSQAVGYNSREELCDAVLSVQGDNDEARRSFAANLISSVFEIPTNAARCSMLANDLVNDVLEPIISADSPDGVFEITDTVIYNYTGFRGINSLCNAFEIAFTMLSGTTVALTITGETLNGEELMYTDNLANRESADFKNLEMVYCGVVENHLTTELGSSLGRLNCTVISFSPGSVVAEMEIEVFATTQDIADSLAQDVADLSTSDSLTLSSDGDTLSVSSLSATVPGTDDNPEGRGMSTRAFTGIVVGVAVLAVLL